SSAEPSGEAEPGGAFDVELLEPQDSDDNTVTTSAAINLYFMTTPFVTDANRPRTRAPETPGR
ncbi:MAG: hypothetical protein QOI66_3933, partial [Myxococcales bacterium]|nr:hypothetical protein [Myxococcales bacterium]